MPLVSNGIQTDDTSETDPILPPFHHEPDETAPLCEIRTSDGGDLAVNVTFQNNDADESCSYVNGEPPQCRICLENGGEDLIAPCHCKGTQKYVHRECLDHWRSTKEGFAFAHCTECRARFILRANVPADRWWLRLKFQFLVARDHALIFIAVQLAELQKVGISQGLSSASLEPGVSSATTSLSFETRIVALLSLVVYKYYGDELREMFGYEEHPYGFYTMAALAMILVGLLYGFFIAIICGQKISERHYHVLAKKELSKEYIVEDRECRDVPELNRGHISELRMLGLY